MTDPHPHQEDPEDHMGDEVPDPWTTAPEPEEGGGDDGDPRPAPQ
jgi:hypothetical protein